MKVDTKRASKPEPGKPKRNIQRKTATNASQNNASKVIPAKGPYADPEGLRFSSELLRLPKSQREESAKNFTETHEEYEPLFNRLLANNGTDGILSFAKGLVSQKNTPPLSVEHLSADNQTHYYMLRQLDANREVFDVGANQGPLDMQVGPHDFVEVYFRDGPNALGNISTYFLSHRPLWANISSDGNVDLQKVRQRWFELATFGE